MPDILSKQVDILTNTHPLMSDVYEVIGHASFLPNIFRASKINMKQ
jgi:hypothetical protein